MTRSGMMLSPNTVGNRFLDHLQIVEAEDCVHRDAVFAQIAVDVLLNGQVFIEADECMILQSPRR